MSIDKLTKIGSEKVEKELIDQRQIEPQQAKKALRMINPEQFSRSTNDQLVASFADTVGKTNKGRQALDELQQIFGYLKLVKVDPKLYRFDPSIARGLASYTGPVWEFEVIDGGVGSICGAGRFDNAIGKYLGKGKQIPATGGSFGVERICQILKDRQMVNINTGPAQVLVTIFSSSLTDNSIKIANQLRTKNINTSLYPITNDKLNKQLKYAAVKNIPWIIIIGPDEAKTDQLVLKNLSTGRQQTTSLTEAIKTISAHDQD